MLAIGLFSIAVLLIIVSKRIEQNRKWVEENDDFEEMSKVYYETIDLLKEKKYFLNKSLKLSTLSQELGYADRLVSKSINTFFSGNFNSFVNSFRVEHSKGLLTSGKYDHYTVEAIAEESGFSNKVSFYNAFKKETDMSPTEFRALKQPKK